MAIINLCKGMQPLARFLIRFRRRVACDWFQMFGSVGPNLLGYGAPEMLKFAVMFHADLTIVHSEAGLWVGDQLIKRGRNVGVDFEDWFSEDLLPEARARRPIKWLRCLEARLASQCRYCLTTSSAMAAAIAKAYNASIPNVVYNVFPAGAPHPRNVAMKDRHDCELLSVHWFSQTIGPGRGIESLMGALPLLRQPVQVHLRGDCSDSTRRWLESIIPPEWRCRIFIHNTVSNEELPSADCRARCGSRPGGAVLCKQALHRKQQAFSVSRGGTLCCCHRNRGAERGDFTIPGLRIPCSTGGS